MSVAAQNVAPQAVAAAGQVLFPFGWRCDDPTTVIVYVNDVQDGGFAVALNADQVGAPGGTITRALACLGGEVVTVERQSPQTQTTSLTKYGPFPASTLTAMADKLEMQFQELAAVVGRCFRIARSAAAKISSFELPAPVNGALLTWVDAGGGLSKLGTVQLAVSPPGSTIKINGEVPVDSGNHLNFNLAHVPVAGTLKLYRNGIRIAAVDDFAPGAGTAFTLVDAFAGNEKLIADYEY